MITPLVDFQMDGWTPAQYEYCSRAAYWERRRKGEESPHVTYEVALAFHRKHKRGALLIPTAGQIEQEIDKSHRKRNLKKKIAELEKELEKV